LRFLLDAPQVVAPTKALRVELVDVFRAGRTRRKPPVRGDDLQAADRRPVTWRRRQQSLDWVTGKLGGTDDSRRQVEKNGFFFRGGVRVDPLVEPRVPDHLHVYNRTKVGHVRPDIVVSVGGGCMGSH
jgi:hypothetical protein